MIAAERSAEASRDGRAGTNAIQRRRRRERAMVERTVRIMGSAGGAVALAIALIAGPAESVRAADELEKIQAEAGRQWYDKYCTPCHGAAGAPGSATFADGKKPVDLRDYVARNGGRFPAERWISVVTTENPTLVHTAAWKTIRDSQGTSISSDAAGSAVVVSIAYYVQSIQR
jgi:mono/diheme cytochrome c family protein